MHSRDRQRLTEMIRWHPSVSSAELHRRWNEENPEAQVSIETVRRIRRPFHRESFTHDPTHEQIAAECAVIQQTWTAANEQRRQVAPEPPYAFPVVHDTRWQREPVEHRGEVEKQEVEG